MQLEPEKESLTVAPPKNGVSRPFPKDKKSKESEGPNWKRIAVISVRSFALMLIGHFVFSFLSFRFFEASLVDLSEQIDPSLKWIFLAGFLAQLIDGALGMGYGVASTTMLLSAGVPVPAISGSVHTAEIFASGATGYSHYRFKNVNRKLFRVLVIPGVLGAILGALLLVYLGDKHFEWLRPIMAAYTSVLGARILFLAFRKNTRAKKRKFQQYRVLASIGGFLDSFGGGGWGPIVTSTLISTGRNPRYVIGSVSVTEFFVTLSSAFAFFTMLGLSHWPVIVALIAGGLLAAPLSARLAGRLNRKVSLILLGILVLIWSIRIIAEALIAG